MPSPLVATWRMSNEATLFLLGKIAPAWLADRYAPRARTVAAQFAHVHNVRVRWLAFAGAPEAAGLEAFPRGAEPKKTELKKALKASEKAVAKFLDACEEAGQVRQWNGPPATFLGYLVAHDAHHRALAMAALRVAGRAVPQEVVYVQWDWGKKRSAR